MSEKVIYTGHFVEDPDALLGQITPRITEEGTKTHAHHITREFRPSDGIEGITPGKRRMLLAVGEVAADGVHVVLVRSPEDEKLTINEHAHLTIATAPGVSPVKSNEVLASAIETGTVMPIEPPIPFEVVEGYFNGHQDVKG